MKERDAIIVFNGKNIRRTWHNDEWWFVLEDIVQILINSSDPKQYIQRMKQRDLPLSKGWVHFVHTLQIDTFGGKQKMNCVNVEGVFRIIQSIPSSRAEPFKLWLAKVGYDRVREIENPELAQMRMKELYEKKGYSKDWIDKRLRGIAIRQNLTDEWKERGIVEQEDFAILTAEISKATFGLTPKEYKFHKNLPQKSKINLRDHMDDIEIILTMLGEAITTRFTRERDSKEFPFLKKDAKDGGDVAGSTRKDIEKKLGKSVVSSENFLEKPEEKKRIGKTIKKVGEH